MITKERLQELIEQGATIWKVPYGTAIETKLHKYSYACNKLNLKEDYLMEYVPNEGVYVMAGVLSKLFENFEEAKWEEEFGNITRTEKLELPTWEEYNSVNCKFSTPKGSLYSLQSKIKTGYSIEKENPFIIRIEKFGESGNFIDFEYTKENYTLACQKCKELFLGGENE